MKALLLAAGLGTRLRPFTFHRAKAALPLLNVPFIHYPLQYLYTQPVSDVVINLHAHPDSVRQAAGDRYRNLHIHYSHEPEILGTAGAIRKALPMLGDRPFAIMNGDMLVDIPLQTALEQHLRYDADITLVVMKNESYTRYNGLRFVQPESGPPVLSGIREGDGERYHYTGVQIVSPRIVSLIPENQKCEIFLDIYPQLIRKSSIHGFLYEGLWMEIGTLKEYLRTSLHLLSEPLPEPLRPPGMGSNLISPQAAVKGEVVESIVMDGAVIQPGTSVVHSIIGWDVAVSRSWKNVALARGILPWYINERHT